MGYKFENLKDKAQEFFDFTNKYNLSADDAYVCYAERECIQMGRVTPLGNFVISFYRGYKPGGEALFDGIVMPIEMLNEIVFRCVEAPSFEDIDIENKSYNLLSKQGLNKVIELWVDRLTAIKNIPQLQQNASLDNIDVIQLEQNNTFNLSLYINKRNIAYALGLTAVATVPFIIPFNTTAMITIGCGVIALAMKESLPAVISNPISIAYNSINSFVSNVTLRSEELTRPREI